MPRRISALRAKRNGRRVKVVLDGSESFPVSNEAAAALAPGQSLEPGEIERLKHESALEDSFARCFALIARRPRSRAEIERYLRRRRLPEGDIGVVLARLIRRGWIDDKKFARQWVENRQEFHPRSERALRMELRRLGIPDDDAREALQGLEDADAALAAARKKAPGLIRAAGKSPDGSRAFQQKMTAFLASRGFDYSLSRESARTVWEEYSRSGEDT
jgi:regulatory protein